MQVNYSLDSDSDEEDENKNSPLRSAAQNLSYQLQDIDKLKEQTKELLDPSWKDIRNKQLIQKMLELEQPTITVKMVDFLLQEKVCESFIGFITQNNSAKPRAGPNDQHGESMKSAYRAVILLSPETPSDPLNSFLCKKTATITRKLFDIFLADSAGSFYHAYRLLECLIRCYPTEMYDSVYSDGFLQDRISNLLKNIGFSPVCELLVMIVACTPLPRNSPTFTLSTKQRWMFLEKLNHWNLFYQIAKVMTNPLEYCNCKSYVSADQHSSAAAFLVQELVEKLSLEDTGDLLLPSLVQDSSFIDLLIDSLVNSNLESHIRRSSARIVNFLLRRAAESEIVCFVGNIGSGPPTATYVPNRLFALREKIVTYVKNRLLDVVESLLQYDETSRADENEPIKYSAYEVKKPFGALRSFMIEVIALTVESEETVAGMVPLELWKKLISWSLKYSHNNVYHALFYRLVFAVLRQGQETPQRILFQKAKFVNYLIDNFIPYDSCSDISDKNQDKELHARRILVRGLLMNCANAIRLQLTCQTQSSFLATFLNTHIKWNDFILNLMPSTEVQMKFGMGIKVSIVESKGGGGGLSMFINEAKPSVQLPDVTDVNSRFARSLGFYDENNNWSLDAPPPMPPDHEMSSALEGFMREKLHSWDDSGSGRFSYLADENDFSDLLTDSKGALFTTPPQHTHSTSRSDSRESDDDRQSGDMQTLSKLLTDSSVMDVRGSEKPNDFEPINSGIN